MRAKPELVTLLALPGAAILVVSVSWLNHFKATWTDKDPGSILLCANAIENIVRLLATATRFRANSLDLHHRFALASL